MNYKFSDKFLIRIVKDEIKSNGWKYKLINIYKENDFGDYNLIFKLNMFVIGKNFIAHVTNKNDSYCYTIFKDDEEKFRYLMEKADPLYEHVLLKICEGYFNDHK